MHRVLTWPFGGNSTFYNHRFIWTCLAFSVWSFASAPLCGDSAEEPQPEWIWSSKDRDGGGETCLQRTFHCETTVTQARLWFVAEFAEAVVFINGRVVGSRDPYSDPVRLDVTDQLVDDANSIAVCCRGVDGPSAIALRLQLTYSDGRMDVIATGKGWEATGLVGIDLELPKQPGTAWHQAVAFGAVARIPYGPDMLPQPIRPRDEYAQWKQALNAAQGTDPATFQIVEGFTVSLIRSAAEHEDSWVGLACDDLGRWIVAKEKKGLLRFTLDSTSAQVLKTETINDSLAECRGLLFAFGSLYAMANNDKALFRLRDTTGDDRFDDVRRLAGFKGDVGHGRNQITLGPDGKIYAICGDAVFEPDGARALPPQLGAPNQIERTRSAFIARTDPDGREWQIVSRGLRNPFGIDFNEHGEIFTYDADAEYDMGSSWYRPTRVNHVVVGGDYGWRRVTKRWPPYFPDRPDMPQPTLDIGKGSPTAVAFGHASRFPSPWREALYVLDWSYGRILAVHLVPRGSSYAATADTFLRGTPLNVTDVEFGPDGSMYFITGGRGTQSALYRVEPISQEIVDAPPPTTQQHVRRRHADHSRKLRRELERLYQPIGSTAVEFAWPHLNSDDPWVRNAARTAIEWQQVAVWQQRALDETNPDRALAALLALDRAGTSVTRQPIVARLNKLDLGQLAERQKREAIFLYERCLTESDGSSDDRRVAAKKLSRLYPDRSFLVNRRLSSLLAELNTPAFVEKTIGLLREAETQAERFHYLFVLRNSRQGWAPESRETYYDYFRQTAEFVAGEGMPRFLQLIESESLATVAEKDRDRIADQLRADLSRRWLDDFDSERHEIVQKWTLADFSDSLRHLSAGRDLARGERMFGVARCIACHRVGTRGGVIGPDLTSVSGRFGPRDLLTSIIEPSKVVAEKYRSDTLVLDDGRIVSGRVLSGDFRSESLFVMTDPLAPEKLIEIKKSNIEAHEPSQLSQMPQGLLDSLSKDEVLDLVWWIQTARSP